MYGGVDKVAGAVDGGLNEVEHASTTAQASAQQWSPLPPAAGSISPRTILETRIPMPNYAAEFVQAHNPVLLLAGIVALC